MTFVIFGYYGFGNAGDEAILASIVVQFRTLRGANLRLVVASGNPAETAATHGVDAIRWNAIGELEEAIASADLVVIGGGGLFHDYWGADPDTVLTNGHWGVSYYATCAFLARFHRKPLMVYAVGVGPLVSDYGRRLTRAVFETADLVTVRDEGSRALLTAIGIAPERVRVTADPAFGFEPRRSVGLRDVLPRGFALQQPVLAVAARRWTAGVHPPFLERELARTLDLFVAETGGSVVLFPFQEIEGEAENDRAVAERIAGEMRQQKRVAIARGPLNPDAIVGAFRECDVVLGMRLHALIFAALAGVRAVALSYDPKVDAALRVLRPEADAASVAALDVRAIDAATAVARLRKALVEPVPPRPVVDVSRDAVWATELLGRAIVPEIRFSEDALDLLRRGVLAQLRAGEKYRAAEASLSSSAGTAEKEALELRRTVFALEGKLDHKEQIRRATLTELERYRTKFETDLASYRGQRAWQVMLLFRKAYTLLTRGSKVAFLKWAVGAVVGRWGSLAEYDLPFPDVRGYLPALFTEGPTDASSTATGPSAHVQRNQYDVIILSIIDFDFRFQRPQQIAVELARRGHRVFWVSPSRFLSPTGEQRYEAKPLRDGIWEVHLACAPPDVYMGQLSDEHAAVMAASLDALARDWGIGSNIVLAQLPFWRRLALRLRAEQGSKVLYDCMDDWETFENMGPFNVSEEKPFVRECDLLVVTGKELLDKYVGQGLWPLLVRNGVDFDFYQRAAPSDVLAEVAKPVVGYFGAIADWIDLDLVLEVAKRRPQYSFVLIGQVFGRDVSALEALPNVRLLGNKRYEDLPFYLYQFGACLIPFLINQVTKATDPVKLYEYFSLGKPVVATDMAELQYCGDLVYIGRDADEFASRIDEALSPRDRALVERRIEFAQANTWRARVQQLDGAVRELYPLLSILIVTFNSEEFVRPCLDAVLRNTSYPRVEIVVVDNASTDGTAAAVAEYGDRVMFLPLPENTGFAAGNNRAAHEAHGEWLLFLNVDTMVAPGWVDRLLRHFERDPRIGLACPVTNFAGNEVKVNFRYETVDEMEAFASDLARKQRGRVLDIAVAPLYCALMRRAVWQAVGELDTTFGIGMFEDDDLSMKIRERGLRVVAAEDCFVHHFGQGSFAKLPSEAYNQLFEKNRKRFEDKWKQPWTPHRTRAGVKPASEDVRFTPAAFK